MNAQNNEHTMIAERLAPIAMGLSSQSLLSDELQTARQELRDVTAMLDDAESGDLAATAAVLSDLMEIAACSISDMDDEASTRLMDCLANGVTLLRESLLDADAPNIALGSFLKNTREEWSDCLAVVDAAESESSDSAREAQGDEWVADDNSASSSDVKMILSSLNSVDTRNAAPTETAAAPKNLFDAVTDHSVRPAPPTDLPVIDDIVLEPELLEAYLSDADQCLTSMEQAVLEFESGGGETAVQQLCRELHTLKGASASVGLTSLGGYLHQIEEWLEQVETPDNLDSVLRGIDLVRAWVANQQQPQSAQAAAKSQDAVDEPPAIGTLSPASPGLTSAGTTAADMEDSLRVKASQIDRLMDLLADLVMLRSRRDRRASQVGDIHGELQRSVARIQTAANDVESGVTTPDDPQSMRDGHLSEIAGDLIEVARSLKDLHDPLVEENHTVSQFIRQFRHELMELRRMPVVGLFRRLQRAVRDAARVEDKAVRLEMIGEHAGLERSVQERLYEPLLHLVRNAVSHGIESATDRMAAGKPSEGTITLEALGSAQMLVLEIRDDGRGLDYEAIRRRGIECGLMTADQEASRSQLAQLIFHPGFSTRKQANEVAGRGVGMDVVASALRKMHARIDLDSEPGKGTTIRLRIPLHSVIEHTMVFRCGGQLFALPVQSVRAVSADELQNTHDSSAASNDVTNPLRLATILGLPSDLDDTDGHCLVLGQAKLPTADAGETPRTVAVIVDEILGPDEVVVRSLPPLLRRHPLLAGATLSGGGDVVQLLDCDRLVEAGLSAGDESEQTATPASTTVTANVATEQLKVLVVDDSLSARRSLIQKLRPHGFDMQEAGDGFEALDRIRNEHFDMVFSDLEMPRMGGFDLLAEVRSNRKMRSLPFVIVTTRGETEYRQRADELGCDGYLTKPVSTPDLEQMLEQLKVTMRRDNVAGVNE